MLKFDLDNPGTSSVENSPNKLIPKPMEPDGNHSIDFRVLWLRAASQTMGLYPVVYNA